jgi:hypothetical protein
VLDNGPLAIRRFAYLAAALDNARQKPSPAQGAFKASTIEVCEVNLRAIS